MIYTGTRDDIFSNGTVLVLDSAELLIFPFTFYGKQYRSFDTWFTKASKQQLRSWVYIFITLLLKNISVIRRIYMKSYATKQFPS